MSTKTLSLIDLFVFNCICNSLQDLLPDMNSKGSNNAILQLMLLLPMQMLANNVIDMISYQVCYTIDTYRQLSKEQKLVMF